jgi:hypothetical protein
LVKTPKSVKPQKGLFKSMSFWKDFRPNCQSENPSLGGFAKNGQKWGFPHTWRVKMVKFGSKMGS